MLAKETLVELYCNQKMSMAEIAKHLGVPYKTVVYWMSKHGIPRRSPSEATYVKRNPDGDPFKIKKLKTKEDSELFAFGVGLYAGEGKKTCNSEVGFANTDARIIKSFLRFLREICGVNENKIVAELNIFDDVDLEAAVKYWMYVTNIPRTQFVKPIVRKSRDGTYKNKSVYGTLTVRVFNKKLLSQILSWCDEMLERHP
jgi:hypothetical protein